jgi:hypothetical protein
VGAGDDDGRKGIMAYGFFPSGEAALVQWGQTFAAGISASPTTYGLVAAQCTAFTTLSTNYTSAFNAASNPNTRNKALTSAKNQARDAMKASARLLASIINGQPNVTDQQKLALGLNVRAQPQSWPIPQQAYVKIMSVNGRTVKVALSNSNSTSSRRGLPAGVQGATVFSHVGATPPDNLATWKFEGNTGRSVFQVAFPSTVPAGSTVFLTAFYFNGRKQSGAAAPPTSTQLAGGLQRLAA